MIETTETEMERFYRLQLEALRDWRDRVVDASADVLGAHYYPTPRWERFRRTLLEAANPTAPRIEITHTTTA